MRVKVSRGPAAAELQEQGWRQFLVKVHNEAGTTAALRASGPNLGEVFRSERDPRPLGEGADLWLDLQWFESQPLAPTLGGLELEYRIVQLYSRDAGNARPPSSSTSAKGPRTSGSAARSPCSSIASPPAP